MNKMMMVVGSVALVAGCASQAPVGPYEYPDTRTYTDFVRPNPEPAPVKNEIVELKNAHGVAKVSLIGANVFSYVPAGGEEVLFSVANPDFASPEFQHVGIPVVWPWFNMNGEAGSAMHSFVRQMKWTVVEKTENKSMSKLVLELVATDETRRLWPYDFQLRYTVTLTESLQVSLVAKNTDQVPWTMTEGFHSYFRVSDVDSVVLRGLDGCRNDRIASSVDDPVFHGDLKFHAGEGRVFFPGKGEYVLFDEGKNRALTLAARGNRKLILWSIPQSSSEGQFAPDDWKHFVCLEPSTISRDVAIKVLPGREHELRMTVQAFKLK